MLHGPDLLWVAVWILLGWGLVNLLWLFAYRRDLHAIWREPVLRHPVLVVESDDWGAGPLQQAPALSAIADVLARYRDTDGRTPTLNLAIVLAVPDDHAIVAQGTYARLCLDDSLFAPILAALQAGRERGVFALQLHGMEHYWPDALMASRDPRVAAWLRQSAPAASEALPPHLQSRWVDASRLPSASHEPQILRQAVAEEIHAYRRIFGLLPKVVVPPTFVWTRVVEAAWADQGIECVVTPGWRYTCRDGRGQPAGDEGPIDNGGRSGRLTYLVRTDFFEPSRGRDAAHALRALDLSASQGHACLLENHRDNFFGDERTVQYSLVELDALYRDALTRHVSVRFLSSWELARILRDRDALWVIKGLRERLPFLWARVQNTGRAWKLASFTGLGTLGSLLVRFLGRRG